MRKKIILNSLLASICYCSVAFAGGGGGMIVFDPTNYTANSSTMANMAVQIAHSAVQLQQQYQMLMNQIQNLQNVPNQVWDNAQQNIDQLSGEIQQGQSLAYSMSNLDSAFKQEYPGYADSQEATTNYSKAYQGWVKTNQDTMNGVLDQMHTSYQQLGSEEALNAQLAQQAQSAQGRMQAIQVGSEIASQEVSQLQKLKATIMAQTNAQAEYYAYQTQKDAIQQKSVDEVLNGASDIYPHYQEDSNFGLIPSFGEG